LSTSSTFEGKVTFTSYKMFDFFHLKFDHLSYSKKICTNIVKFKSFLRTFINKQARIKISDILHKNLNKMSDQIWCQKIKYPIFCDGLNTSYKSFFRRV
jgi:hypothetical protein